jgi:transcriptional regulator with XRE-family HTH domain
MVGTRHDLSSFGELLKAFRKRRHLTQQQLASFIGVHRSAIVRWEQGDSLPQSKALVLELARCLKLDDQETREILEASLTALAPYWSVPLPRNPFFTGREEILEALHAQLGTDRTVALTQSSALHGLGGVGKTQIALEYAYQHALSYHAVFWIEAETAEQIIASLLRIAETLQLPERTDQDQHRVVAEVQRWLTSHGQWLVIWDNVEDLALLDRFLPAVRQGAVLITTRCRTLGTRARGLDLFSMEQEESILFLLRRAKMLSPEATSEQVRQFATQEPVQYAKAGELVAILGRLPLALDQAGPISKPHNVGWAPTLRSSRRSAWTCSGFVVKARASIPRQFPRPFAWRLPRPPTVIRRPGISCESAH